MPRGTRLGIAVFFAATGLIVLVAFVDEARLGPGWNAPLIYWPAVAVLGIIAAALLFAASVVVRAGRSTP